MLANSIIEKGGLPFNKMLYSDIQYSFLTLRLLMSYIYIWSAYS